MPPKKKGSVKKTTKPTNSKATRPYNAPKKAPKDKEFVGVPQVEDDDDLDLSDEDLAFFSENKAFGSFLTGMDAKELTRNVQKKKSVARPTKPTLESVPEPGDLTSSDDDDYDDLMNVDNEPSEDDELLLQDLSSDDDQNEPASRPRKKAAKQRGSDDEEMDYELQPRQVSEEWTKKDFVNKLPIKLPTGHLAQAEKDEASSADEADEPEVKPQPVVKKQPVPAAAEQDLTASMSKKEKVLHTKETLAELASTILEDPEEHVKSLKQFRKIYATDNVTIKKLTLLTQLAVYKDILPGYRIRPLTEQEMSVKVSKEVKKLRDFEKILLSTYEMFLKDLQTLLSKRNVSEDPSLAVVATRCLCDLLVTKPHFNFRLEIMVSVIARMSTLEWDEMAELSYGAIVRLFEQDESGRYSLDAMKMITRMVRSKGYQVHEKVVATFMSLRLKEEMRPVSSTDKDDQQASKKRKAKDKPFLTKKARKALKETKLIEKEFEEAEAVVSQEEKEKHHTETLKLLFAFYFRILKKQASSPLLPSVLEGLSKFAHLINVDFFNDLLNALRDVMLQLEDSKHVNRGGSGTRKRLLCVLTAFELLSGQGEAINYDLKDFYREVYQVLLRCTYRTALEEEQGHMLHTESELLLQCMDLMLLKKRQIPVDRLAAFVKRWTLVSLNMPTKSSLRCLTLVRRLLQKDQRLDALIQSEDRASTGVYQPLLQDPELCNPFGTSLYELFLYQNHYDPRIRQLAQAIQKPSTV
ncbi:nucleolar complex-associated protein 3 [Hesseltinella vesiculosa]|uniref:Nucleolar complex-associated protein 3 n=1 Tax=Hesseltinella vesiculosa TaxID=101127 RepID=A0A1X2GSL4_9FUNG|nr:nucleolar complex-associated protein 3 [Hesseltinella vesiculosa]